MKKIICKMAFILVVSIISTTNSMAQNHFNFNKIKPPSSTQQLLDKIQPSSISQFKGKTIHDTIPFNRDLLFQPSTDGLPKTRNLFYEPAKDGKANFILLSQNDKLLELIKTRDKNTK